MPEFTTLLELWSDIPKRWEEETVPAFVMDHDVPVPPSIASAPLAVVFTLPVLVIAKGLFVVVNVSGPVTALLIVWPPPLPTVQL